MRLHFLAVALLSMSPLLCWGLGSVVATAGVVSERYASDKHKIDSFLSQVPSWVVTDEQQQQDLSQMHNRRRRRLNAVNEYSVACANPDLLYNNADIDSSETFSGLPFTEYACACNATHPSYNRILCSLLPIGCDPSNNLCLLERDVWIFDKGTGQLEERATCLDCVSHPKVAAQAGFDLNATQQACDSSWENTCFLAFYDNHSNGVDDGEAEDDMTSCSVLFTESEALCSNCRPCQAIDEDDGELEWGMNFDCPLFTTSGGCVTGNRLGHHPWDVITTPAVGDGDSTQTTPSPTTSSITESDRANNNDDDDDDDDTTILLVVIVALAVALIFCTGLVVGWCICVKKAKSRTNDENTERQGTWVVESSSGEAAAPPGVGYAAADIYGGNGSVGDAEAYNSGNHHDINIVNKLDTTDSTDDSFAANL